MKTNHQTGFSIVELLIGMIAAAILALAAGSMLASTYRGWARSLALADLERDAMVAVSAINYAVRGASTNGLDTGTGNDKLTVTGSVVHAFTVVNSNLVDNGDFSNPLVHGRQGKFVSSFIPAPVPMVQMTMVFCDPPSVVTMTVSNMFIRLRN